MRNIRLTIEYDGTNYAGWQTQRFSASSSIRLKKKTIQETIEKALRIILREKVSLTASGRTDAGVHAEAQIANFRTNSILPLKKIQFSLNSLLPGDIAVTGIKEMPLDFHARFNARSKLYRYTIINREHRSVFLDKYAWHCYFPLDTVLMRKEAAVLVGKHDFKSFTASGGDQRSTTRVIREITIEKKRDVIVVSVRANGFLYNMVRNIVGTLVDIGRGRLGNMRGILRAKDRKCAGMTAPAKGLCLVKVYY
ncbi:MAG: tRNA pseudouridine(38-40) synthase TruA [Candidatus Omnitrophota bacterium]|jgi:tRNA pseudouridine38-40 synthase